MKSMKRALRRHHRQRMIRRAFWALRWMQQPDDRRDRAVRWCNNLANCSCDLCGNPRTFFDRITTQELRLLCRAFQEAEDGAVLPPGLTRRVCRYRR